MDREDEERCEKKNEKTKESRKGKSLWARDAE